MLAKKLVPEPVETAGEPILEAEIVPHEQLLADAEDPTSQPTSKPAAIPVKEDPKKPRLFKTVLTGARLVEEMKARYPRPAGDGDSEASGRFADRQGPLQDVSCGYVDGSGGREATSSDAVEDSRVGGRMRNSPRRAAFRKRTTFVWAALPSIMRPSISKASGPCSDSPVSRQSSGSVFPWSACAACG